MTFIDQEELPNGVKFRYLVVAVFVDDDLISTNPLPRSGAAADVTAINNAPVAVADSRSTNEDIGLTAALPGVLVNDFDADSALKPSLIAGTTHGILVFNPNGTFTYSPNADFYGADVFSYKLLGGTWPRDPNPPLSADSATVLVTITVNPVNDAPSFTKGGNQTVPEDASAQTVAGWATNLSVGAANETGGGCVPLLPAVCQQTLNFDVTNNNNTLFSAQPAIDLTTGTLTYTPKPNANGTATVTATLHDSGGTANGGVDTRAQTFNITVTPVNDAPAGTDTSVTTAQNTAKIFAVGDFGFTDSNDNPANNFAGITITTLPATGTLSVGEVTLGAGSFVAAADISLSKLKFTPDAIGSPYFTFQVKDDGGTANLGVDLDASPNTMTITVLSWVLTTAVNCGFGGESPDVTVEVNSVMMGLTRPHSDVDLQDNCIHGASALLPPLSAGNTKYSVTFRSKLFSWDAYNASGASGTGYWDSFSVSLSKQPYAQLTLTDPLVTGASGGYLIGFFVWGGTDFLDGILDCFVNPTFPTLVAETCTDSIPAQEMTVIINGNTNVEGNTYLNVVLDTTTQPESNGHHPSYGTITILNVVQLP